MILHDITWLLNVLHGIYTFCYMTYYIVHYMNNYRNLHDILHEITCHSMELVECKKNKYICTRLEPATSSIPDVWSYRYATSAQRRYWQCWNKIHIHSSCKHFWFSVWCFTWYYIVLHFCYMSYYMAGYTENYMTFHTLLHGFLHVTLHDFTWYYMITE